MAPFDECSVLIPSATLEDFPSDATDSDARSMLAAWTVLWHPKLIAETEQLPTWHRADSPPEPDGPRIVVVPNSSLDQLPSGFENKCKRNKDCVWVTGVDRAEMLAALQLESLPELTTEHRTIGIEDFFAAGFASLQIQIMTRRLRYTSNLDEIYLQKQVVAAAKAFVDRDAETTVSALHNVFDGLAEERDHYFSSDPHLIDLTLLTPATLDKWIESDSFIGIDQDSTGPEHTACLRTPQNVFLGADVANAVISNKTRYDDFRSLLNSGQLGWIGGAPPEDAFFDTLSFVEAEAVVRSGQQLATNAIGKPPKVYGRFTGGTPVDLTPTLVRLGYAGMVPIDFARGTGYGDEAKVIQRSGGAEIESLTAKPIDAASDASFLNLAAKLGEAIDSGEIATGLLAHWPGQSCDSFDDLRRVASWCLALGRFWKIDEYFVDGEQPYHQASARSVSTGSSEALTRLVSDQSQDPISTIANSVRNNALRECSERMTGMTSLVLGKPDTNADSNVAMVEQFAEASGIKFDRTGTNAANAFLLVNASGVGQRVTVTLDGHGPAAADHIYAQSMVDNRPVVSVDVPAMGFATVQSGSGPQRSGSLIKRWFAEKKIADANTLQNEFMEVVISESTGGIQGVYSGATRGNRFSLRLVMVDGDSKAADASTMKCNRLRTTQSSEAVGEIEATGEVLDSSEKCVATFTVRYRLERGSRLVKVCGDLKPVTKLKGQPWENYFAARGAVASESGIARVIVRDKLHRGRSRRLVAPLGLVMDEAERQTLIGAAGFAFHRRVEDRFVDTLLAVKGETNESFRLHYGFDVPHPVQSAESLICDFAPLPIIPSSQIPPQGWITHVSPGETMLNSLNVFRRNDGLLAATVRVIQTRSKSASVSVRFCRDVLFATNLVTGDDAEMNQAIPKPDDDSNEANVGGVKWKQDAVKLMVLGHEVSDLLVVFAN